jgi:endonuclease/exonuclease/phosphatase family metal-dependent hydrolase
MENIAYTPELIITDRIIDCATSKSMITASTCFPTWEIHKITWTPPDRNTSNQIDHALIDTRRACNSLHVRSYRRANCDSDHCSVPSNYRG